MSNTPQEKYVKAFSWLNVDDALICSLLEAHYGTQPDDEKRARNLGGIDQVHGRLIRGQAQKVFGKDPSKRPEPLSETVVSVLRWDWLPTCSDEVLDSLLDELRRPVSMELRTRQQKLKWLQTLQRGTSVRWVITRAFCRAHRRDQLVTSHSVAATRDPLRVLDLAGADRPGRELHDHQAEAVRVLDARWSAGEHEGLLVMPTGAGKTHTVVSWLLDRMEADPTLRVLWLAHRRDLVDQSASAFHAAALERPEGFRRVLRLVHSSASELATIVEPEVDVAVMTVQSLLSTSPTRRSSVLRSYFSRPVVVVVDEAHHAGAKGFDELLTNLVKRKKFAFLVGLTATPYPTSQLSRGYFDKRFGPVAYRAEPGPLVEKGVLARQVVTVVETGRTYQFAEKEVRQLERGMDPAAAYGRLNERDRNELVVRICTEYRELHGPTLVFAADIAHADELEQMLTDARVKVRSLHSRSDWHSWDVFQWFEDTENPVLVSVGMLTEGVDLPKARTALLARPTSSRILMQQMVGRVLRGPEADGDPVAHIVYLRDIFTNFSDLLDPAEVLAGPPPKRQRVTPAGVEEYPDLVDDDGKPIPFDIASQIGRAVDNSAYGADPDAVAGADRPIDILLTTSDLVGYYRLDDHHVAVLENQLPGWQDLISTVLDGDQRVWLKCFDDLPPPAPGRLAVNEVVEYVRRNGEAPPFHPVNAAVGPAACARLVLQAGALTDGQRHDLIARHFRSSVNSEMYRDVDHFEEAVEAELRDLRRREARSNFERVTAPARRPRLVLPRDPERKLGPAVDSVCRRGAGLLPPELAGLLEESRPSVKWGSKPLKSAYAYWTVSLATKDRGKRNIVVNPILRTTAAAVPDDMLEYLLWHELLHDLLPGHAHDAVFRDLEHRWPGATQLDAAWSGLPDRYNLDPAKYR